MPARRLLVPMASGIIWLRIMFFVSAMGKVSSDRQNALDNFSSQCQSIVDEGQGIYFEFDDANAEIVYTGQLEGRPTTDMTNSQTVLPLASASKLFTAFAAMRTMQLKPKEFYPGKQVNEFPGWESFRDFSVHGSDKKVNLTIHHLLTHTSGIPFSMTVSKEDIEQDSLLFWPGTQFGYTIGHRLIGWLLRDFWQHQSEIYDNGIKMGRVQDCYAWLIFDKLKLSRDTRFAEWLNDLFGGEAGDASIQTTGEDFMKLAVVALRKGRLLDGVEFISEDNWNKWAIPNLLPGGKLSEDLVSWQASNPVFEASTNAIGLQSTVDDEQSVSSSMGDEIKAELIMKQSGDYGWNYFGATFKNSTEVGWCGFFSSCLQVSYTQDIAVIMMQRAVTGKASKTALRDLFNAVALELQCKNKTCTGLESSSICCKKCTGNDPNRCVESPASGHAYCPHKILEYKFSTAKQFDPNYHRCYVPKRHSDNAKAACRKGTGGTCRYLNCDSWRGQTECSDDYSCLCSSGHCASDGECVDAKNPTCHKYTGRHSHFGSCNSWVYTCPEDLNATCVNGYCMCGSGSCFKDGMCRAVQRDDDLTASASDHQTLRWSDWNSAYRISNILAIVVVVLTISAAATLAGFCSRRRSDDAYMELLQG